MSEIFPKIDLKFYSKFLILQLTTKLKNMFSNSITKHFIPSNKNYHSYCNLHWVYQTSRKINIDISIIRKDETVGSS